MNKNSKWKALANTEVDHILNNLPTFKGTMAKDLFKGKINANESGVINLDDSGGQGTHFTAYYNNPKHKHIYYFDSYGFICPKNIEKYLQTSGKQILYSNGHLQMINSTVCGYYCIMFIVQMEQGMSFYDFLAQFDETSQPKNDEIVKKWVTKWIFNK